MVKSMEVEAAYAAVVSVFWIVNRILGDLIDGMRLEVPGLRRPEELIARLENSVSKAAPLLRSARDPITLAVGKDGFQPSSKLNIKYSSCHHAVVAVARSVLDQARVDSGQSALLQLFADLRFSDWSVAQSLQYECVSALRQLGASMSATEEKIKAVVERAVKREKLRGYQPQEADLRSPDDYLLNAAAAGILKKLLEVGSSSKITDLKGRGKLAGVFRVTRSVGVSRPSLEAYLLQRGVEEPGEQIDKLVAPVR